MICPTSGSWYMSKARSSNGEMKSGLKTDTILVRHLLVMVLNLGVNSADSRIVMKYYY